MKLAEHRWVRAIWCDDIRQEVGNKPSFMWVDTESEVLESFKLRIDTPATVELLNAPVGK